MASVGVGCWGADRRVGRDRRLAERGRLHDARLAVGTIQLLLALHAETEPGMSPAPRGELWAIARELEHLARLLDEDPGGADSRTCDLAPIAEDVAGVHQKASGTSVRWHGPDADVRLGRTEVWRVLDNLVANACRAAGPCGTVVISTRCGEGSVTLRVEDSGPGLEAGTPLPGLGVRTVSRILAASGGSLRFEPGPVGGMVALASMPSIAPRPRPVPPVDRGS